LTAVIFCAGLALTALAIKSDLLPVWGIAAIGGAVGGAARAILFLSFDD
jgi:hypothetical protein